MAMNKAEKAELERAKTEAALRWTEKVAKDVPVPVMFHSSSSGWKIVGESSDSPRVEMAWSSTSSHGTGFSRLTSRSCAMQGGIRLYSTKILALKALRNSIEERAAAKLRAIDLMIEAEEGPK